MPYQWVLNAKMQWADMEMSESEHDERSRAECGRCFALGAERMREPSRDSDFIRAKNGRADQNAPTCTGVLAWSLRPSPAQECRDQPCRKGLHVRFALPTKAKSAKSSHVHRSLLTSITLSSTRKQRVNMQESAIPHCTYVMPSLSTIPRSMPASSSRY